MAHIFGNPSASPVYRLNAEDKRALQCILDRKTKAVPKGLREEVLLTLDEILYRPGLERFPFPLVTANGLPEVPFAATFAGHLHFRGPVMEHAQGRNKMPLSQWPEELILAYFISNVDEHRNFNMFFAETRTRLYALLVERTSHELDETEEAYLKACLEYKKHPYVTDLDHPVKHQVREFSSYAPTTDETTRVMRRTHQSRNEIPARAEALDQIFENNDDVDVDDIEVLDPAYQGNSNESYHYKTENIDPCAKNNLLLRSLIAPIPGLTFGTTVTLIDDDAFATANFIDALPQVVRDDDDMDADSDEDAEEAEMQRLRALVNPDEDEDADWNSVNILIL